MLTVAKAKSKLSDDHYCSSLKYKFLLYKNAKTTASQPASQASEPAS